MSSPFPVLDPPLSHLCSALDLLAEPGFVVDDTGRIIGWNRRLEALSGVPGDEMMGKDGTLCGRLFYGDECPPLVDLVLPSRRSPDLDRYVILEQDPTTVSVEVHLPGIRGGSGGRVLVKATVVTDRSGAVIGGIESLFEIGGRPSFIEGLLAANANLHQANRVVRHDIMNELTIVLGYIDLAAEAVSDPDIREDLTRASRGARRIQEQVEFTRQIRSHGTALPLWHSLDDAVAAALHLLPSKAPKVTIRGKEVQVLADPLFTRVIATLLSNACRRGGDQVTILVGEPENALSVICTDNGRGISAGEKKRLFDGTYDPEGGYGLFLDREVLAVTGIELVEVGDPDGGGRFEMFVPSGAFRVETGAGSPAPDRRC